MSRIVIIGAGPAGLTAAYELLKRKKDAEVIVFEETEYLGGISRTAVYQGNRMDMGGHRFFSKMPEVNAWWEELLPTQGAPSYDDLMLHRKCTLHEGGPDPEKEDAVMLRRNRISRIFFRHKFFDYPISMKKETLQNMGLGTAVAAGFSYLKSAMFKRKELSLEDFYINRFGKKLYEMFFENYTENLWGRHPSEISPEWGAQRVKGLSVRAILKDMIEKKRGKTDRKVETSLIEEFSYPKYGPGQLWELTAEKIREMGGEIRLNTRVTGICTGADGAINRVRFASDKGDGEEAADVVISSMPLKDLTEAFDQIPEEIRTIGKGLPYRDYMTAGVLLKKLALKNETEVPTLGDIVPDNWIYVHERGVQMGRIQLFNNWSPYMVQDPSHTVFLGLEYFCNEGDALWNMTDEAFCRMAVEELLKMEVISSREDVIDTHAERVKKAYPAYFDTYEHIEELRKWLDTKPNLFCVGRNGQHRYNNMDHSMMTAFEAVNCILSGSSDRQKLWNINTEKEYHEETTNNS